MTRSTHFFDLCDPEELFGLLKSVAESFSSSPTKRVQDLLLLVFGLTHLREWIAPGYDPQCPATMPAQKFFQQIYTLREFKTLQHLCNRSKHMVPAKSVMGTLYVSRIDNWPHVDAVRDFERGFPSAYSIDDRDVLEVIQVVIAFYDKHWFQTASSRDSIKDGQLSGENNGST
ncbi:MAG: hypothetical protein IH605_04195 [Burkholderiales bacterium]|nr:hypothetical protein [Burkholderiales bacterium]